MRLSGKTAVVTGASSGIGAATAQALRAEGARLAVGARRADRLDGDFAHELDVTDADSCGRFVERAVEALGPIDILVNNAGLALGRYSFSESTTVAPGLVETEFSLVRFRGGAQQAADVYRGVEPLTAQDIAECIIFAVTRPLHVNVDEIVIKALAQTSGGRILRQARMLRQEPKARILRQEPKDSG